MGGEKVRTEGMGGGFQQAELTLGGSYAEHFPSPPSPTPGRQVGLKLLQTGVLQGRPGRDA